VTSRILLGNHVNSFPILQLVDFSGTPNALTGAMPRKRKSQAIRYRPNEVHQSHRSGRLSIHQQEEKVRGIAALNLYRRGEAKSLSAAVRAEGTTIRAIRRWLPGAITQARPGGRIRVKPSDRYAAQVEVLTIDGQRVVTARGSRQRELAGRHRASFMRVLQGQESPAVLEQYRGKTVGGHELISDFALLSSFAQAGIVGQLDSLYVSPDATA
jgi:hypothetical protein